MSRRILVIRGGALGDFILGLPALRALRGAFPADQLELIAPSAVLSLASHLVDVATPIELAQVAAFFGDAELPSDLAERYSALDLAVLWLVDSEGLVRRNLRRLGARQILQAPALPSKDARVHASDYLLTTLHDLRTGVFIPTLEVSAGQAPKTRGMEALAGRGAEASGNLSSSPAEASTPRVESDRQREDAAPPYPFIRPTASAIERARALFGELGLAGRQVLAIHPGSGGRWKCWPAERFARVTDLLGASGKLVVLIQGQADEEAVAGVLHALKGGPAPVLSGLSVEDLAAALSLCAAYLGNDSGVTHLAAALGTPTVALFGPTDPAVWGPRGRTVTILRGNEGLLDAIAVEQVREAVTDFLQGRQE